MNEAILLIGGNKPNTLDLFDKVIETLNKNGIVTQKKSSIYKTAAWGNTNQNDFYNRALLIKTDLKPIELLHEILSLEKLLGRVRNTKWESRSIDIDIIFYNQEIIKLKNLEVPHKHMHERNFVLKPIDEIVPTYIHPVFNKTISELLLQCADELNVEMI